MFNLRTVLFAFVLLALLLLGPEVLGAMATAIAGPDSLLASGLFAADIRAVWSQAPGVLINIVFACLPPPPRR